MCYLFLNISANHDMVFEQILFMPVIFVILKGRLNTF